MRSLLAFGGISLVLSSIGIPAIGQEVQPVTVVDAEVSIVYPGEEIKAVPRIASGTVRRPEGCDFCYLHDTQYRIEIPEGSIGLVIELENLSDPRGDIDLIVREGEPVSDGSVAGGLFAGLRVWRRTLVAPFAAHLALNVLEFVWIGLAR